MKKVLLTAMAILTLASASAFGMYGAGDGWIDFLVHGNQFRARMDRIGFTLGNGTIKGTFGFNGSTGGVIMDAVTGNKDNNLNVSMLAPTLSMGIGYTSPAFGIGVGYNYTMKSVNGSGIHTPVLAINALNNNLRIVVPFQIATMSKKDQDALKVNDTTGIKDYMGIRTDVQIRYYTGVDAFNAIRFYFDYAQSGFTANNTTADKYAASSLGLELRLYFLNTAVGNVNINPYLKLVYKTALKGSSFDLASYNSSSANYSSTSAGDTGNYQFTIAPVLGLGASSDIVTLWFEPSLGYTVTGAKDSHLEHRLAWGAYAELYLTPVKDLEWYFEVDVNNTGAENDGQKYGTAIASRSYKGGVSLAASTGITWYLPSFGAAE